MENTHFIFSYIKKSLFVTAISSNDDEGSYIIIHFYIEHSSIKREIVKNNILKINSNMNCILKYLKNYHIFHLKNEIDPILYPEIEQNTWLYNSDSNDSVDINISILKINTDDLHNYIKRQVNIENSLLKDNTQNIREKIYNIIKNASDRFVITDPIVRTSQPFIASVSKSSPHPSMKNALDNL